jgi:hypothetical protein
MIPVISVVIMNAVGLTVVRLSHPGRVVFALSIYVLIDRSMSRQTISAMIMIMPRASIRDGVLIKRSLTTNGSLRNAKSRSTPY